jgi:hypothetical protein
MISLNYNVLLWGIFAFLLIFAIIFLYNSRKRHIANWKQHIKSQYAFKNLVRPKEFSGSENKNPRSNDTGESFKLIPVRGIEHNVKLTQERELKL